MANVKISALGAAGALTGTEPLPIVQGGVTLKTTTQDIANLSGGGGFTVPTLTLTPALPNWAVLTYRYPVGIEIDGVSTPITTFGLDLPTGDVSSWYYALPYGSQLTAISTTAEAVSSSIIYLYNSLFASPSIVSMSLPTVKAIIGTGPAFIYDTLYVSNSNLTTISLPSLVVCGGIEFQTAGSVTSVDFSSLSYIQGSSTSIYSFSSGLAVPTLSFPSLNTVGNSININEPTSVITSVSLPALTYLQGSQLQIVLSSLATSVNLNSLELLPYLSSFNITAPSLTSFGLPALRVLYNSAVLDFITSLDQTSVDNILIKLASLDGTANTSNWTSGTVNIAGSNAAPSGAGYAAAATLTGRGVSVVTN